MDTTRIEQAFRETPHSPGISRLQRILANGRAITDFCIPVNIGFPPPEFLKELHDQLDDRLKYYPSEPPELSRKFADFLALDPRHVLAGNGSTELFYNFLNALEGHRRILTCIPTFGRWTEAPRACGHTVIGIQRREQNGFSLDPRELVDLAIKQKTDTVLISNPNNPTGHLTTRFELLQWIDELRKNAPGVEWIVIDESFLDFSARREEASLLNCAPDLEKVIVLKSLGKSFGMHGTRMGVLVSSAANIQRLHAFMPYWNVNGVAEAVIDMMPGYRDTFRRTLDETIACTKTMAKALNGIPGARVYGSEANFVYMKLPASMDPLGLRQHLLEKHSMLVRSCGNKEGATARHFRIATRLPADVQRLVEAIVDFQK